MVFAAHRVFLLETESNRMINIYYFHEEDILSPNSFKELGLFLLEEEKS